MRCCGLTRLRTSLTTLRKLVDQLPRPIGKSRFGERSSAALKRLASAVRFRPWPPDSRTYEPTYLSLVAFGCTFDTLTAPSLLLSRMPSRTPSISVLPCAGPRELLADIRPESCSPCYAASAPARLLHLLALGPSRWHRSAVRLANLPTQCSASVLPA